MNNIKTNRGKYLETLISRTAKYYWLNKIGLIKYQNIPISIKDIKENKINAHIIGKSDVDYYGFINNKFICFEAKQTNGLIFRITPHIKEQIQFLVDASFIGAFCFILIYIISDDGYYAIDTNILKTIIDKKIASIKTEWIIKNCKKIDLIFPGILDLISLLS